MLWTWGFWKDAIERAIRAAANTMAGILVVNNVPSLPGHIDSFLSLLVAGVTSAVGSILLSVGASGISGSPNASMVGVKGDPASSNKP